MSYHLKMNTCYILVKIFKGTFSVDISFTFFVLFQLFINWPDYKNNPGRYLSSSFQ